MEPLTIKPGRHPFEWGAFLALLISGIAGIFGARSNAIVVAFPSWFVTLFYAIVTFWAAVGLVGLLMRDLVTRLGVERLACYGIGVCALAYLVAAFAVTGWTGTTAALGVGWISVSAGWRVYQIHIDLRRLRESGVLPPGTKRGGSA